MDYTGIGSRQTPPAALSYMTQFATDMAGRGYVLRSGHAPGADQAFERGANGKAQIFLPWASFESDVPIMGDTFREPTLEAAEIAAQHHPAWDRLRRGARRADAQVSRRSYRHLNQQPAWGIYGSDGKIIASCRAPDKPKAAGVFERYGYAGEIRKIPESQTK